MSFSQQDLDKLDKAKLSPQVFYLDKEVQGLLKELNFFDLEMLEEESDVIGHGQKTDGKEVLFGKGKAAPAAVKVEPVATKRDEVVKPEESAVVEEPEESEDLFDLNNLKIEEEEDNQHIDEENGDENDFVEEEGEGNKKGDLPVDQKEAGEDDELDLS